VARKKKPLLPLLKPLLLPLLPLRPPLLLPLLLLLPPLTLLLPPPLLLTLLLLLPRPLPPSNSLLAEKKASLRAGFFYRCKNPVNRSIASSILASSVV
jgi:hypothetical protein